MIYIVIQSKEGSLEEYTTADGVFDDYSSIIANTEKNLPALIQAGFDSSKLPYYRGCLEMLAVAISDPSSTDPEFEAKLQKYYSLAKSVMDYKAELVVVGRSIAKNSENRKIQQKFKHILKGTGIIDDALDILGLVTIAKQNTALAARIRPDGKLIDEAYCTAAVESATELLQLKGFVIVNGVPQHSGTEFINRLITLCMDNLSTIKEYAQAHSVKTSIIIMQISPANTEGTALMMIPMI
jgi:hypothetical protein